MRETGVFKRGKYWHPLNEDDVRVGYRLADRGRKYAAAGVKEAKRIRAERKMSQSIVRETCPLHECASDELDAYLGHPAKGSLAWAIRHRMVGR